MTAAFAWNGAATYAQTISAPGSSTAPHYTISSLSGGVLTQITDGGTPVTSTFSPGSLTDLANQTSIGGNDFLGSIRTVIAYNTVPSLTALNAYLHSTGGF
jgi:hypothetical protein